MHGREREQTWMYEGPYCMRTEGRDVGGIKDLWTAKGRAQLPHDVWNDGVKTEGTKIGSAKTFGNKRRGNGQVICIPTMRRVAEMRTVWKTHMDGDVDDKAVEGRT